MSISSWWVPRSSTLPPPITTIWSDFSMVFSLWAITRRVWLGQLARACCTCGQVNNRDIYYFIKQCPPARSKAKGCWKKHIDILHNFNVYNGILYNRIKNKYWIFSENEWLFFFCEHNDHACKTSDQMSLKTDRQAQFALCCTFWNVTVPHVGIYLAAAETVKNNN